MHVSVVLHRRRLLDPIGYFLPFVSDRVNSGFLSLAGERARSPSSWESLPDRGELVVHRPLDMPVPPTAICNAARATTCI